MSIKELWERIISDPRISRFIRNNQSLLKKVGVMAVVVVIAAAVMLSHNNDNKEEVSIENESTVAEETAVDKVCVDIGGEVNSPMVVELDDGSRVQDAIEAAGGLTDDADIKDLNRAAFVNDGDKIYVPSLDEASGSGGDSASVAAVSGGKVNINTADSEELQTLTGVGPVTADKIIEYRESNGRFSAIDDIKNVSGIGDKTFEKLKASITT